MTKTSGEILEIKDTLRKLQVRAGLDETNSELDGDESNPFDTHKESNKLFKRKRY